MRSFIGIACAACLAAPATGLAQTTLNLVATTNATVQPAGPRTGSSGLTFFNIQGSDNGSFASFGVVDFAPAATAGTDITDLSLELVQSNAFFTTNGDYSVYLTDATSVAFTDLNYQSGNDGVAAVDTDLTNLSLLGSFSFVEVADGTVDTVDLFTELDATEEADLIAAINAGSTVRLVIVPDAPTVSATYAGQGNFAGPAPTLVVELGGGAAGGPAADAWVNEIHYDNSGTDQGEFIEIAGPAGSTLEGWELVLYNGTSSVRGPYDSVAFTASDVLVSDASSGSFGFFVQSFPTNGIQNGAPDGWALVDPFGAVTEFRSYEGSFVAASGPAAGQTSDDIGASESSSTNVGFSLQLAGSGTAGSDFIFAPPAAETPGATNRNQSFGTGPGIPVVDIMTIQGAGHWSPEEGNVVETTGIVTAVGEFDAVGLSDEFGFFLQDPAGDGDLTTSDAVFVVSTDAVAVGDEVMVQGIVEESGFTFFGELPYTRLQASTVAVVSSGNPLPTATLLGMGGRVLPAENIDDDAFTSFDPMTDGLDFFESIEAMRVTVQNARAVSPTSRFGEVFVVADDGQDATGISQRGTLNISPDDFNPEKIQLDPGREFRDPANFSLPDVDVGATFGNVTGVVGYDFGNFQVQPDGPIRATPGTLAPEVSKLFRGTTVLSVASYNVLNLDPNDADGDTDVADGRFDAIAGQIVNALDAPDVLALQEIQDNSGSVNDGIVSADLTLQALVDAIALAGGPTYAFIDNTFIVNNNSGGQPGANIRTAFLYDPSRVTLVSGSVRTVSDVAAFAGARLPLIATFEFNGESITIVNNHLSSKGGSAPIFGLEQPFEARQEDVTVNGSLDERQAQSAEVRNFVDGVFAADPKANLVVLGDLNEFEFVSPVEVNLGAVLENLTLRVPADERYTFNFQGNSQSLDHILVSPSLSGLTDFDIVRVNSEFAETNTRASDHEPLLASFALGFQIPRCFGREATVYVGESGDVVGGILNGYPYRGVLLGGFGDDVIAGTKGRDVLIGLSGDDLMCGGAGRDLLLGGRGHDQLDGGDGKDRCIGGPGRDREKRCR